LWFISCIMQIFLFLIIIFKINHIVKNINNNPFRFFLMAFCALAIVRFAVPALFNQGGIHNIEDLSVWMYLPTTHIATFVLGMLLVYCFNEMKRVCVFIPVAAIYCY